MRVYVCIYICVYIYIYLYKYIYNRERQRKEIFFFLIIAIRMQPRNNEGTPNPSSQAAVSTSGTFLDFLSKVVASETGCRDINHRLLLLLKGARKGDMVLFQGRHPCSCACCISCFGGKTPDLSHLCGRTFSLRMTQAVKIQFQSTRRNDQLTSS